VQVFCNIDSARPDIYANKVLELFLKRKVNLNQNIDIQIRPNKSIKNEMMKLDEYIGLYYSEEVFGMIEFFEDKPNGLIYANIKNIGTAYFKVNKNDDTFEMVEISAFNGKFKRSNNKIVGFVFNAARNLNLGYEKITEIPECFK
jgi:hypothetical protein